MDPTLVELLVRTAQAFGIHGELKDCPAEMSRFSGASLMLGQDCLVTMGEEFGWVDVYRLIPLTIRCTNFWGEGHWERIKNMAVQVF